ncbi:MAG: hypothetical protein JXR07_18125 [Reichenbachiella sp.]
MTYDQPYVFLTTKPLTRYIFEEQQEYLYILFKEAFADADLDITINYTDNTDHNYQINIGATTKGQVIAQNIGYPVLDYNQYEEAKSISSIEIKIDSESEKLILIPAELNSDEYRELHYFNSLGGMDSLFCTGDHQTTIDSNFINSFKSFTPDADLSDAEYSAHSGYSQSKYDISSGYKPHKEIEAVKDMFLINNVFELVTENTSSVLLPLILDQKSVGYPPAKSNLKAVSFEARLAYDETANDRVL